MAVRWVVCVAFTILVGAIATSDKRKGCCEEGRVAFWKTSWGLFPTESTASSWSVETRIPMIPEYDVNPNGEERGKHKIKKKFKKFLVPLLLAYKLKFFTLIPVLIGLLVLLTGATGLAGFFFALFTAVMGLKLGHH